MARPKKNADEQRSEVVKTTLTVAEKLVIAEQCKAAGLSEAEYTRRRILGYHVPPARSPADAALVSEVNRIGVNVHQLVRAHNFGRAFRIDPALVLTELEVVLKKVAARYDP